MSNKLIVVTGAAGGMGKAIVLRLLKDGFDVIAIDKDEKSLSRLKEMGREFSGLQTRTLDLLNEQNVKGLFEELDTQSKAVFGLVNALGWTGSSLFKDETLDYWRKVIAINYESVLTITHAAVTRMIASGGGRIVSITSDAAKVGTSGEAVYSGLKAAVVALSKSIARENARYNILANCVSPGPTETPLLEEYREGQPKLYERMLRLIPLRRPAQPSEIASSISFLLSEDSAYITGQTISVSGGLTMD